MLGRRVLFIVSFSHRTSSCRHCALGSHGMIFPKALERGNCLTSKVVCGTIDDSQEPEMDFFLLSSMKPNLFCQDSFNDFFSLDLDESYQHKTVEWTFNKVEIIRQVFFIV